MSAFTPPVSAIKGICALRPASTRAIVHATSVEPVNATPAMRGSPYQCCADGVARARQERECGGWHAGAQQELHGARGDERRLLRGFGDDCIARGKRGSNLTDENRQRKIPRADAGEYATSVQGHHVRLAGWRRQRLRVCELSSREQRIVAAEIGRLAHFADRIGARFTRFASEQHHPFLERLLDRVPRLVPERAREPRHRQHPTPVARAGREAPPPQRRHRQRRRPSQARVSHRQVPRRRARLRRYACHPRSVRPPRPCCASPRKRRPARPSRAGRRRRARAN